MARMGEGLRSKSYTRGFRDPNMHLTEQRKFRGDMVEMIRTLNGLTGGDTENRFRKDAEDKTRRYCVTLLQARFRYHGRVNVFCK